MFVATKVRATAQKIAENCREKLENVMYRSIELFKGVAPV